MFGCLTADSNYISSTVPCQRCPPPSCTHTLSHTQFPTHTHAFSLPTTPFLSVLLSFSHTCSHTQTALNNMQHIINLTLSFHTGDKQTLRLTDEGMEPKLPARLLIFQEIIPDQQKHFWLWWKRERESLCLGFFGFWKQSLFSFFILS